MRGGSGGCFAAAARQGLQRMGMGVCNLLFFMASLPVLGIILRASASAPTGDWIAAKVPLLDPLSARGTETAKHFA